MNLLVIISVVLFLVYLELGLYVLLKDIKSPLNHYFFALCLCFSIWSFSYIFVYSAPTADIASKWDSWASLGYALFPAFMVGFKSRLCNFPKSVKWQNAIFAAFLLMGLFFVYANFLGNWESPEITKSDHAWYFYHDAGEIHFILFYIYIFLATITTFIFLINWRLKMKETHEKFKYRFVFYPLLIFLFLGVFIDLLLPALGKKFMPNIGHISSLVWIAGVAVSIVRFQLLGNVKYLISDQLIDEIKELVIFIDPGNKIIRSNSFTQKLLQASDEDLMDQDVFIFFENRILLEGFLEKTNQKAHFGPVNMNMKSKTGGQLDVNLYFLAIKSNFDDLLGCIIYGHDNSEALNLQKEIMVRQEAEKNLRSISEVLEMRVKERTSELAGSYKELQLKMTERMRVEEQIKSDIAEKEVLINEIHSRVKNNMNVIIALIKTQNRKHIGAVAYSKYNELAQRVRSLLVVHQNLYLSINYSDVDFANYIKTIANDLLILYKKEGVVELRIEASDVFLDVDYAIPLGIVVNELITNSLQHGFSSYYIGKNKLKKHILHIKYAAENSLYEISVSDNGKGLPKNFSIEELGTNGLPLVDILVKDQISGSLNISSHDEGTSVDVSFLAAK
jgi:two-component sensor histidine kinase